MTVVVTPPAAIVSASEAKMAARVLAADSDDTLNTLLLVAQTTLERWAGSALGKQTVEIRLSCFPAWCGSTVLSYGPAQRIVSVKYDDAVGVEQTLPETVYDLANAGAGRAYLLLRAGQAWPSSREAWNAVRIRYEAGYETNDPRLISAKHAIILASVQLRALSSSDLALRTIDVPGVGSRTYTISDAAQNLIQNTVGRLMAPYRAHSV